MERCSHVLLRIHVLLISGAFGLLCEGFLKLGPLLSSQLTAEKRYLPDGAAIVSKPQPCFGGRLFKEPNRSTACRMASHGEALSSAGYWARNQ